MGIPTPYQLGVTYSASAVLPDGGMLRIRQYDWLLGYGLYAKMLSYDNNMEPLPGTVYSSVFNKLGLNEKSIAMCQAYARMQVEARIDKILKELGYDA